MGPLSLMRLSARETTFSSMDLGILYADESIQVSGDLHDPPNALDQEAEYDYADVYRFEAGASAALRAEVVEGIWSMLYLYGPSGLALTAVSHYGGPPETHLNLPFEAGTSYYLDVSGVRGPYTLMIEWD